MLQSLLKKSCFVLFGLTLLFLLFLYQLLSQEGFVYPNQIKRNNLRSSVFKKKENQIYHNMKSVANSSSIKETSFATIPPMLYGTAWKKEKTALLVTLAVSKGFRGIDTACQPKHYNEAGVGEALENLYANSIVTRSDMFLQTKFTSLSGQDPDNIPYDKSSGLEEQVSQSLEVSLHNLKTTYLDSILLHSPMKSIDQTMTVWSVFERFVSEKQVRYLGISNCYNLEMLKSIYDRANIKPKFLQNRFYRDTGYDKEIRDYCKENDIIYETFWTLTANPKVLSSRLIKGLATKYEKTAAQIWFAFIHQSGHMFLTGTTSESHMEEDLDVPNIRFEDSEMNDISTLLK